MRSTITVSHLLAVTNTRTHRCSCRPTSGAEWCSRRRCRGTCRKPAKWPSLLSPRTWNLVQRHRLTCAQPAHAFITTRSLRNLVCQQTQQQLSHFRLFLLSHSYFNVHRRQCVRTASPPEDSSAGGFTGRGIQHGKSQQPSRQFPGAARSFWSARRRVVSRPLAKAQGRIVHAGSCVLVCVQIHDRNELP